MSMMSNLAHKSTGWSCSQFILLLEVEEDADSVKRRSPTTRSSTPSSRRNSGPYIPMMGRTTNAFHHPVREGGVATASENPSLLSSVGPLDWLFTDSEPKPPPSSPKSVNASNLGTPSARQPRISSSSSQGSSGTDNELKTLLPSNSKDSTSKDSSTFHHQGAIPKK